MMPPEESKSPDEQLLDIPVVIDENCPDMFNSDQADIPEEEEEMADNFEQLVAEK